MEPVKAAPADGESDLTICRISGHSASLLRLLLNLLHIVARLGGTVLSDPAVPLAELSRPAAAEPLFQLLRHTVASVSPARCAAAPTPQHGAGARQAMCQAAACKDGESPFQTQCAGRRRGTSFPARPAWFRLRAGSPAAAWKAPVFQSASNSDSGTARISARILHRLNQHHAAKMGRKLLAQPRHVLRGTVQPVHHFKRLGGISAFQSHRPVQADVRAPQAPPFPRRPVP